MYSVPEKFPGEDQQHDTTLYETSNMRDYKGLPGSPAANGRPSTSTFYSDTGTGQTGYNEDFGWKSMKREMPLKSGSSSGQRKNNPHPLETFMVWKFPDKMTMDDNEMKESLLKELCEDKIRSTYEVDYTGLKQGEASTFRQTEHFADHIQRHIPRKTLGSTARVDYQTPENILERNTTRYGCNEKKDKCAVGVVPTVVKRSPLMKPNYETSYSEGFGTREEDNVKAYLTQYPDLAQYTKNMSVKEKKVVQSMLEALRIADCEEGKKVERISGWDGPSWK